MGILWGFGEGGRGGREMRVRVGSFWRKPLIARELQRGFCGDRTLTGLAASWRLFGSRSGGY